ncbi:hypothetical protein CIK81_06240 [Brachybacterium sp. JB7]|uniref:alpha/beta hydrolase family protein n=1 Tax=Brachybacterium TaxID=43668 RepID=UPI000BB79CA3|nr:MULTISPECIES: hypothetical protein [Brachybacterium]PCC34654.1 hypothetical protein CIK71_03600 [Brachybacterium alimentarium]RCS65761.1 hypothetical protein CIK81_06240 [Brachybacterium sp. JB7]RCS93123.1 hypothetical protein CIK69_02520 [Brachybacterium alimentarium]
MSREPAHPGVRGTIHQLQLRNDGIDLVAELYRPLSVPSTGVVVVVPCYDTPPLFAEPTARTELADLDPSAAALGLQLAAVGHSVLAVPWRFEQIAAHDPVLAEESGAAERYGPLAARHQREQGGSPIGRSVADLMLAVTALQESGLADGSRLATFGDRLGGGLALRLAALDERIEVAAVHEPRLDAADVAEPDQSSHPGHVPFPGQGPEHEERQEADDLLSLIAPRPLLLAGSTHGGARQGLEPIRRARRHWPDQEGPDLLRHENEHALPHHVMAGIREWLRDRTC